MPVRFLVPLESSCAVELSDATCSSLNRFSAQLYAGSFQVTSTLRGADAAPAEVRYYCANNYASYLPVTSTPLGDQAPTAGSNFPNNLLNVDCPNGCSDDICWQYNTGRWASQTSTLPARCTWDNGSTPSSDPSFSSGTCSNVVLEVRYSFEWSGQEIKKFVASVVLADVAGITSTTTAVSQKFSVSWQYERNATLPQSPDNYSNTTGAYSRSGSAGYETGKPLYSGCAEENSTTSEFIGVDDRNEKQVAIWKPGVDGLCANAKRQFLTFGNDMMSSCALRLTFQELNTSCDELRQLVTNHLNVLMAGDVIGRFGYNDLKEQSMWVSILRQNLSSLQNTSQPSTSDSVNTTSNLTSSNLTVKGICLLPTSINLHILYAQTGAVFGYPRYDVVGAFINYTQSNWSMECMGGNSQRCNETSGLVQNFFLFSTVRFIKVPTSFPTPRSRFYTRIDPNTCETDSCYRFYTDFTTEECYYDSCWQQLAYPLTSVYDGDSHVYARSSFLVLVLGIVGYVSVSKPGWS